MQGGMRLGVVALVFASGCLLSSDDNDDGSGGGGGLTVGFAMSASSVDETIGLVEIPVYLSAMPTEPTTVHLSLGGTATLGDDYVSGEGTIVFLPYVDFYLVRFEIVADDIPEDAETIELSLSAPVNARLGTSRHTLEIRPNLLPRVTFASAGRTGYEANGGGLELRVMPASPVPITVGYTLGGTADGSDYTLQPGAVTIPAGATTYDLSLGIVADSIDEENLETIDVSLVDPVNAILGEFPSATFQLYDSDPTPSASFVTANQTLMEGNSGVQLVTAEVQLEEASARQLEVAFLLDQFLIGGNTATAGSDYQIMTPSPLVFPAGTTSKTITLAVNGDTQVEGREKLTLALQVGERFSVVIENDECFGTGAYTVCPNTAPLGATTVPDGTLDTRYSPLCADVQPRGWIEAGQLEACFIIASDITIGSVRASGYALVLVATNSITVNGLLDVGGHINSYGTTSNGAACGTFGSMPTTMSGGAGGSFMTAGGNGGNHNGPSGSGGTAAPAFGSPPTVLRGGCGGQDGWQGSGAGKPGGVVYLVAGSSITLASGSTVNASGAPGEGGYFINNGGNGGGSGGMIVLHAPTFAVSGARLLANGGAGGEGDDNGIIDGTYGTDGSEVDYAAPLTPAPGGTGTAGGDGGRGACEGFTAGAGTGASSSASGGGGGGGLGYILASQPLTGALVSPTAAAF